MSRRTVRPGLAMAAALFLLALPAGAQPPDNKPPDKIRITFVNVGAGLCTVIECPGNPKQTAPILYDCGSSRRGDTSLTRAESTQFVQTILSRYGVPPRVVVSHPHGDHYNYIAGILGTTKVSSIWLGGKSTDYNFTFQSWLENQQKNQVPIYTFPQGYSNDGHPPPNPDFSPRTREGATSCGISVVPTITCTAKESSPYDDRLYSSSV